MTNLATIYKDAGGIGALPGDSVRMLLDTNGLTLGSELVTNGGFDTATGWTTEAETAISGGQVQFTATSAVTRNVRRPVTVSEGKAYRISFDVTSISAGNVRILAYTATNAAITPSVAVAGSYTFIVFANSAGTAFTGDVVVQAANGTTASVDNVSVREIPGIHADQPTTSLQPVLGRSPVSRRNLLTWSEDFTNAAWTPAGSSVAAASLIAPDGSSAITLTENTATSTHQIAQVIQATAGASTTFSVYVKSAAGDRRVNLTFPSSGFGTEKYATFNLSTKTAQYSAGVTGGITDIGNGWLRIWATLTATVSGATSYVIRLATSDIAGYFSYAGDGASAVHFWHPQAELGSTPTPYQKVKSQYDITEPGVPSYSYLRFDAVDDKLPQVYPTAKTGTAMIFGRKGSWDCGSVSVSAGGTLNVVNGKDGPNTPGIIPALGDIVAWYHAPQTLNAYQKAKLTEYFMERGAKGLLVPSGVELVTNGTFASDTAWTKGVGWTISGGLASVTAQSGSLPTILEQPIAWNQTEFYQVKFTISDLNAPGSALFAIGDGVTNDTNITSNGAKSYIIKPGSSAANVQFRITGIGAAGHTYKVDNISVQKLVIA